VDRQLGKDEDRQCHQKANMELNVAQEGQILAAEQMTFDG